MSAVELLEQAQAEGVLLVLDDGHLTWEADHEPPGYLLEEIRTHRLEIIEALSVVNAPSQHALDWLARVARLLECSPEYLLELRFLLPDELAMYCNEHPSIAAQDISSHPDWHQPSVRSVRVREAVQAGVRISEVRKQVRTETANLERSARAYARGDGPPASTETAEFRDQYARARAVLPMPTPHPPGVPPVMPCTVTPTATARIVSHPRDATAR